MKKTYVKPMVQFENFKLTSSMAGDCEVKINNPTDGSCAYVMPNPLGGVINLFTSDIGACTTKAPDGDQNICYHNPYDNNNLFNS